MSLVAACAAPDGAAVSANANPPSPDAQAAESDSSVIPVVQEPAGAESEDAAAQTVARTVRPDELMGKNGAEITELLGEPSLIRRDSQAQIWQYRGRACVLDLFFYPPEGTDGDAEAAPRAVVYFETRGKDAERVPGARCLNDVASRARAG